MSDFEWSVVSPPDATGIMEVFECGGAMVVGTNQGMLRSEDEGSTWTACSTEGAGGWLRDAHGRPDGHGYVVGDQGRVWRTQDGGRSFERRDVPDPYMLEGVMGEGDEVWIASAQSRLWHSADRGETWTRQPSPSPTLVIYSGICRVPGGPLLASGTGGTVVRSGDGEAWALARQKGQKFLYGIASTGELVVAPADKGSIFVSTNGGETFATKRSGTKAYFYAGAKASERRAWVGGKEGAQPILLSTEDGKAWLSHVLPEQTHILGLFARSDDELWVAGSSVLLRGRRRG